MTFEEYLQQKKIDSEAFKAAEPERWTEWNRIFAQLNPDSFTMQKLNLINLIRRRYKLSTPPSDQSSPEQPKSPPAPQKPRPVMRPKIG